MDDEYSCKILEFKLTWYKNNFRNTKIELRGSKAIQFNNRYKFKSSIFTSMYDTNDRIIGTQFLKDKESFKMTNFKKDEFQFKTNIALTGYKIYHKEEEVEAILVESRINPALLNRKVDLSKQQVLKVLSNQLRTALNSHLFNFERYIIHGR